MSRQAAEFERLQREAEAYFALREIWKNDPVQYFKDRLGMSPTWQQKLILDAIKEEGAKVSVRSGHGTGKSGATSGIAWWFLETREYCKVPCTAPTAHQLKDVLWAELAKWLRKSDEHAKRSGIHPRFWLSSLFRLTEDRIYDSTSGDDGKEWYAVARTSGRSNPDALQGFHASDVTVSADGKELVAQDGGDDGKIIFIVDEASGVFEGVFEVAEGALSSHGARLLMLGNPTKTSGYFYRSHHQDRAEFETIHLKTSESPLGDPDYRPRLVRKYGEDSNVVRVRADGEFPKQDDDTLIALEHCEAALVQAPYDEPDNQPVRMGVDVARFGNDRTVIIIRQGRNILGGYIYSKKRTTFTVGECIRLANLYGVTDIYPDDTGLGGGVTDGLVEAQNQGILKARVHPVTVAATAPAVGLNPVDAPPYRLRDYLWMMAAQWLQEEAPSFAMMESNMAEDLAGELSSCSKYTIDSSGNLRILSKEEMKKELGFSPDLADALNNTFAQNTSNEATMPGEIEKTESWSDDYGD